jgi:hypothetical protein
VYNYTIMITEYEKQRVEMEFKAFTARNFERPASCRNLDQTRYYVRELCGKIEEYESRFNYVPQWVYTMLSQYNMVQNKLIEMEFKNAYS